MRTQDINIKYLAIAAAALTLMAAGSSIVESNTKLKAESGTLKLKYEELVNNDSARVMARLRLSNHDTRQM